MVEFSACIDEVDPSCVAFGELGFSDGVVFGELGFSDVVLSVL